MIHRLLNTLASTPYIGSTINNTLWQVRWIIWATDNTAIITLIIVYKWKNAWLTRARLNYFKEN
jgi:hypothetical protein